MKDGGGSAAGNYSQSLGTMTKIYDREGAMRRMGNDVELFQEMVEFLHQDTPRHMSLAKRSWSERDFVNLVRAAHTLKGLASNFGAARAVAAAAELERLAAKGLTASIEAQFLEIEQAFEELLVALPVE